VDRTPGERELALGVLDQHFPEARHADRAIGRRNQRSRGLAETPVAGHPPVDEVGIEQVALVCAAWVVFRP